MGTALRDMGLYSLTVLCALFQAAAAAPCSGTTTVANAPLGTYSAANIQGVTYIGITFGQIKNINAPVQYTQVLSGCMFDQSKPSAPCVPFGGNKVEPEKWLPHPRKAAVSLVHRLADGVVLIPVVPRVVQQALSGVWLKWLEAPMRTSTPPDARRTTASDADCGLRPKSSVRLIEKWSRVW